MNTISIRLVWASFLLACLLKPCLADEPKELPPPTYSSISSGCRSLLTKVGIAVSVAGLGLGLGEWHKRSAVQQELDKARIKFQQAIADGHESPSEVTQYLSGLTDRLLEASGHQNLKTERLPLQVVGVRRMGSRTVANTVGISEEHLAALDYEAEVAAVLAHELAHAILKHDADSLGIKHGVVWGSVRQLEELGPDKDLWNGGTSLYQEHLSDAMHRHEFEADALSLQLLEKAAFPKEAAVSALLKVATADKFIGLDTNTSASPSAIWRIERLNELLPAPVEVEFIYQYKPNRRPTSGTAKIPGQENWRKIPGERVKSPRALH